MTAASAGGSARQASIDAQRGADVGVVLVGQVVRVHDLGPGRGEDRREVGHDGRAPAAS